jgi:hypothetical protein
MLRRLDGEEARIQQLVSKDELSPLAGGIGIRQLRKSREALRVELETLQQGT